VINGFNVLSAIYSYVPVLVTGSRLKPGFNHATDKHDTPPSHFKLTLGQPALL